MTSIGPTPVYCMWMWTPAFPSDLPRMKEDLAHCERCSKSPDIDTARYYTRQAEHTRTAINELEGLIRAQEEKE